MSTTAALTDLLSLIDKATQGDHVSFFLSENGEVAQARAALADELSAIHEVISITAENHGTAYSKIGRIRALLRRFDHAT